MFSITVVRPKQVNPSTAGFANLMSSVIPRPPPSPSPVSSLADLLVHQLLRARDQLVYHTGLGQGAGVAQGVRGALGYLPEDPSHDLAAPGLRQSRRELDDVGSGYRADLLAHVNHKLLADLGLVPALVLALESHIRVDALPLD